MKLYFYIVVFILTLLRCTAAANAIPDTALFIGNGYNLLMGNPDGDFWLRSGDDPGLLLGRSIFSVSRDNIQDEISYLGHLSCHQAHSVVLIHGPKSYQDKLLRYVHLTGTEIQNLTEAAFSLSNGYQVIKQQTERHHYVYQDQETRCMLGKAVHRINLGPSQGLDVTKHFAAAMCALPKVYDVTKYMSFIDTWGTHVVTEIELGWQETYRYGLRLEDYILKHGLIYAQDDVTIGGQYMGASSSYRFNLDSFKYRQEFAITAGNLVNTLKFGTITEPEPVGMTLMTLDGFFSVEYLKNLQGSTLGQCFSNGAMNVEVLRINILKALETYSDFKQAVTSPTLPLVISIVWPEGTYGIPMAKFGCPDGIKSWKSGWRYQNTETQDPSNRWSPDVIRHMEVVANPGHYNLSFCIKTDANGTFQAEWPVGDFCIFKYRECPKGFQEGFVRWDDEDTGNRNSYGGYLPSGVYDQNTEMRYCCRSDGKAEDPIDLPTERPFYLFKYKHGCQNVRDMTVTEEYLLFDDDDKTPPSTADIGTVHPGMQFCNPPKYLTNCGTASTIYYCYYHR